MYFYYYWRCNTSYSRRSHYSVAIHYCSLLWFYLLYCLYCFCHDLHSVECCYTLHGGPRRNVSSYCVHVHSLWCQRNLGPWKHIPTRLTCFLSCSSMAAPASHHAPWGGTVLVARGKPRPDAGPGGRGWQARPPAPRHWSCEYCQCERNLSTQTPSDSVHAVRVAGSYSQWKLLPDPYSTTSGSAECVSRDNAFDLKEKMQWKMEHYCV